MRAMSADIDFQAVIDQEGRAFIEAMAAAPDAPVPWCDDWTAEDMGRHLGMVWSFATANVGAGTVDEMTPPGPEAQTTDDTDLAQWLHGRLDAVLAALAAKTDDDAAWSFAADNRTVGFWRRRMAQETAVHRWDAQAAGGLVTPIDSELATDGIEEYFAVGLRFSSSRPDRSYPTETLHLHRTDGPGEWMLVGRGTEGFDLTHEHGKGDAAVRGPADALLLWIWGRPTDDIEIFGDESVAAAWQALAP